MKPVKAALRWLPQVRKRSLRLNFYRCHLAYFIITILVSSLVIWGSTAHDAKSPDSFRISYADSLFMAASAMTTTGLSSVNLGSVTGYQQSVFFVLMLLGDLSTVSISVVVVRRLFFQRFMGKWVNEHKSARQLVEVISNEHESHQRHLRQRSSLEEKSGVNGRKSSVPDKSTSRYDEKHASHHRRNFGGFPAPWETSIWKRVTKSPVQWLEGRSSLEGKHHYLSFEPQLDQKGRFRSLGDAEYAELGGVEYRALTHLCWILPTYTAFWILLGMVILGPYAANDPSVRDIVRSTQPGDLSPGWWGVFMSLSSYTNCGLDPINASMVPFQRHWLVLIVTGGGIMAGNTFYPIFLRAYIWILSKVIPKQSSVHHSLAFLLHHPRRCYLWLFDEKTTWILTGVQFGLILGEWVLFEILNIRQTAVWVLSIGTRTMDGLYQSLGTRSSGMYIVTISSIAPALQIIYMVVMYLSVFPLIVSLRTTNVYEERSIGLEVDEYENNSSSPHDREHAKGPSAGQHIRNQLAYDLWWIVLSWVLICVIEEPQLNIDAPGYNPFTILFEVVSAYGNCGLSLGIPYNDFSLCGTFHTTSKLILITVMLRGRHRILPMAIDRSILIPGEGLMEKMDHDYNPKLRAEYEERIRRAQEGAQAEEPDGRQDPEQNHDGQGHDED